MKYRVIVVIAVAWLVAFAAPVAALTGCCACLTQDVMSTCPSSGAVCFTNLETCAEKCSKLGCPKLSATIDAVCGQDGYELCQVIDPGGTNAKTAPVLSFGGFALLCIAIFATYARLRRARQRV